MLGGDSGDGGDGWTIDGLLAAVALSEVLFLEARNSRPGRGSLLQQGDGGGEGVGPARAVAAAPPRRGLDRRRAHERTGAVPGLGVVVDIQLAVQVGLPLAPAGLGLVRGGGGRGDGDAGGEGGGGGRAATADSRRVNQVRSEAGRGQTPGRDLPQRPQQPDGLSAPLPQWGDGVQQC